MLWYYTCIEPSQLEDEATPYSMVVATIKVLYSILFYSLPLEEKIRQLEEVGYESKKETKIDSVLTTTNAIMFKSINLEATLSTNPQDCPFFKRTSKFQGVGSE